MKDKDPQCVNCSIALKINTFVSNRLTQRQFSYLGEFFPNAIETFQDVGFFSNKSNLFS